MAISVGDSGLLNLPSGYQLANPRQVRALSVHTACFGAHVHAPDCMHVCMGRMRMGPAVCGPVQRLLSQCCMPEA